MSVSIKLVSLGIRFSGADKLALAASGCELLQFDSAGDLETAVGAAGSAEAVCVSNVWQRHLPPDFIGRLQRCRLLVAGGGIPDVYDAELRGISVANCPTFAAPAIAEHAFALLFALARKLAVRTERPSEPGLASNEGLARARRGVELRGKTLGIACYPLAARHIARIAAGLGMKPLISMPRPPSRLARFLRYGNAGFVKFAALLPRCDAVIAAWPDLPAVRGLFDAEAFGLMRPGCLFVNAGGGQAVDEDALLGALARGAPAGAGLDSASQAAAQQLRRSGNVVLSPHMSWNTAESEERLSAECAKNVMRFFSGRPVNLIVDASRAAG